MSNNTSILLKQAFSLNSTHFPSTNRTTQFAPTHTAKLTASFIVVYIAATIILNGLILASFIKYPNLRTPFNFYVINIAIIDVVTALIPLPLNIILQLLGQWPFNGWFCSVVLYVSQLCNAGNRAAHLMIAANRLWAVSYPLSYRSRHTARLAVAVVLFAWSLTICIVTPRVIIARKYVNHSVSAVDARCAFDTDSYQAFQMTFNVVVFNTPEIIILIAYPWLLFKLWQKSPNKVNIRSVRFAARETLDSNTSAAVSSKLHSRPRTLKDISDLEIPEKAEKTDGFAGKSQKQSAVAPHRMSAAGKSDLKSAESAEPSKRVKWFRSKGHNRLFAYLVLSVVCCWTPNHVFYLWAGITGRWSVPFYTVQFFVSSANSWLNPILIYLADLRIRTAVNKMIKCC